MKKHVFGTMMALMAVATTSSAFAGDCRLKVDSTFNVGVFADVDTAQTAAEINDVLKDRKHRFQISNDADAPFVLKYVVAANVEDKRNVTTSFSVALTGSINVQSSGNLARTTRSESKQAKLYKELVSNLISSLPACPNR